MKFMLPTIYYVIDNRGWVQENRLKVLSKYLGRYFRFKVLSKVEFTGLWNNGQLSDKPIYFASWRIPFALDSMGECTFRLKDYVNFMVSVTSHYNIGGGLNTEKALPRGADPQTSFDTALRFLNRFKVVTANSKILYDLLSAGLPELEFMPNGVDTDLFKPGDRDAFSFGQIKIGWVGRIKAAKNYELFQDLKNRIDQNVFKLIELSFQKRSGGLKTIFHRLGLLTEKTYSLEQMPRYYQGLDFYLCTSWHEGTPNPALEAASCGVPILTTRVGNMPELIVDGVNGFFIEPELKNIIAVLTFLQSIPSDRYEKMRVRIRNDILKNWSWENRMKAYRNAFDKLTIQNTREVLG